MFPYIKAVNVNMSDHLMAKTIESGTLVELRQQYTGKSGNYSRRQSLQMKIKFLSSAEKEYSGILLGRQNWIYKIIIY